jgi:hypothetical protein
MGKKNESLMPLIATVVICVGLLVVINIFTSKQISPVVPATVTVPDVIPSAQSDTSIHSLEKEEEEVYIGEYSQGKLKNQAEKLDELISAQHNAFLQHAIQQPDSNSKYNLYPDQEQLKKIKDDKLLMD